LFLGVAAPVIPRRLVKSPIDSLFNLAAHRPFFTGKVSEALLETYLSKRSLDELALSSREKAVVQLVAEGKTNTQIADLLSISTKTIKTYRALALRKLEHRTVKRTHSRQL
jgi:DNA-binding NarL/FixJ family response regulator